MSIWTPGGEIPVDRGRGGDQGTGGAASAPAPGPGGATGVAGGPSLDDLSPEERAQAEQMIAEMAEVQRQILAAPAAQIVANHVMGFYELAAIHLSQEEPDLAEAKLAVDAMAAVLDAVEAQLGENGAALRQALGQLQLAYVQRQG
jgi:hypothetical protein